jgi:hypothetical protein
MGVGENGAIHGNILRQAFTRDASLWCCLDVAWNTLGMTISSAFRVVALPHPTRHYFLSLVACMCTYTGTGKWEGLYDETIEYPRTVSAC